ncbi:unnamed protein product [Calypogeia fissa]
MFESAKDRLLTGWWTEPSGPDASHRRHNSFSRASSTVGHSGRPGYRESVDNQLRSDVDATLDGVQKKLQWISREEDQRNLKAAQNCAISNGRPSATQSGSKVHARSASFGVTDCPSRGIPSPRAESPIRRLPSMRRNPSIDFDVIEAPSSGPTSRSTSFQERPSSTSAIAKGNQHMGLRKETCQPMTKYSSSLSPSEEEYIAGRLGEDHLSRGRRKDSSESVMMRLNYLTDMMTNGEIDHGSESLRHGSLHLTEEQTSPSNSTELGTTGGPMRILYKASPPREHFSQEKMPPSRDNYPREPVARSQSEKYQQVRRLLLPEKVLGGGSRDLKLNFFRRSKSLQRGSKIHHVSDSFEDNESAQIPTPVRIPAALPREFDNSFDYSRSSSDTLQDRQSVFPSKIGKLQKFLFNSHQSSDHNPSLERGFDTSTGQSSFDSSNFSTGSSTTETQTSKEQSKFQCQLGKLQKFLFSSGSSSDHKARRKVSFAGPELCESSESDFSFNPVYLGDSQFSEKRRTVPQQQFERVNNTPPHRISPAFDRPDNQTARTFPTLNPKSSQLRDGSPPRWFAKESKVDSRTGLPSLSVLQTGSIDRGPPSAAGLHKGSMDPPGKATRPQSPSSFRGTSPTRWFTSKIEKVGSLARSYSTGRSGGLQEVPNNKPRKISPWRTRPEVIYDGFIMQARAEQKPRKTSPWRTKPAELFQGLLPERRGRSPKWHEDPDNCTPLGF